MKAKGKSLDVVRSSLFKQAEALTAKDLNRLVFALRAIERKINKTKRR